LPEAHYTLGVILMQQSRLEDAAVAFQAAVKAKSDYAEAHYALGTVFQQQGKLDEAITAFRAALKFAPNAPEIHNTLGSALRQKGDIQSARQEFAEGARLNKRKSDIQAATFAVNTGLARMRGGDLDAAIERFGAAVKLVPDDPNPHYYLAKALLKKGQNQAARLEYQKAKQLNPAIKPLE
jgi:Tfp pilus assembly protein PilF